MRIGIIGAGHAGVEAASAASKAGADVILFSAESALPYYRPRLVAVSFGQVKEDTVLVHPAEWYAEHGIALRAGTPAESLDTATTAVTTGGEKSAFDAVVIATGAGPAVPPFAESATDSVIPLWNIEHARQIRRRARPGAHIVAIGGGAIGVETALRAVDAGMRVTIVEKTDRLMSKDFSASASQVISRCLAGKGIRVLTGQTVVSTRDARHSAAVIELQNKQMIEADLVLLSVGVTRDLALAEQAGLETDNGITVDTTLRASATNVFACGDIIQINQVTRCSAREAAAQGRLAGSNACAAVLGKNPVEYPQPQAALTFKYKDFGMYSIGVIPDDATDEILLDGPDDLEYRARIVRDGVTVGVQMVGGGKDFQKYAKEVEEVRYDRT